MSKTGRVLDGVAVTVVLLGAACGGGYEASPRYAMTSGADEAGGAEAEMGSVAYPAEAPPQSPAQTSPSYQAGEQYEQLQENAVTDTAQDNFATFSLDVDTASYTLMRRDLQSGHLPRPESVRVEEYVNFFRYGDEAPQAEDGAPFAVHLESAPSYFGDQGAQLLRVGVQAMEVPAEQRPSANLVFLIDVSGSMQAPDKLNLVQYSLSTLVNTLRPDDTIGIVVYAGREAVLLPPTAVADRGTLLSAIQGLSAGGSTNGAGGIRAAYDLASQYFRRGGINRVILCTDGDFNVGLTGDSLVEEVARQRDRGITLTALGFGRGNFNDAFMERLTNSGNGNYAYVDSENEALRVLGRDLSGTLQVIAKDVKVQVVFNPEVVRSFRLIGYENRRLAHEDFTDDTVDAAEIGSGQFTTAYFEYQLQPGVRPGVDPRRLADVRLRYKAPDGDVSRQVSRAIAARDIHPSFESASAVFRFGAAVAELAEILRHSEHSSGARFDEVRDIAREATWSQSTDTQELIELVSTAARLWGQANQQ